MIDALRILGALLLAVFFAGSTWLTAHAVSEARKDVADDEIHPGNSGDRTSSS